MLGELVLSWDDTARARVEEVGGKAYHLGRLARYGFKIPPGVVVSTEAYCQFVEHNGLAGLITDISPSITLNNLDECSLKLSKLHAAILAGAMPLRLKEEIAASLVHLGIDNQPLAVRSSASAEDSVQLSFAGIHQTSLNVIGLCQIFEAIKNCYASLWTPQAAAYRRRFGLSDQQVLPAVVLMEMVDAQAAGVAFSCDPQTGRRDRLVVHANFGLGESVVNGNVEPDSYYLDASAWHAIPRIADKKPGRKEGLTRPRPGGGTTFTSRRESPTEQALKDEEIEKLGLLILRVFETLGEGEQHQDIEWAFDGQELILLQARPVTALPSYTFDILKGQKEVWSNGNYRDALPMVLSPLHRRVMKNIIDTMQFSSLSAVGYSIPEGLQFSRLVNGRLYCNISALQWTYYDNTGAPPRAFNPSWGGHQSVLEVPDGDPFQGEQGLVRQERIIKSLALMKEAAANAENTFAEITGLTRSLSKEGFSSLADHEFIKVFEDLGAVIRSYSEIFSYLAGSGNMPLIELLQKLAEYLGERTMLVANGLMVGGQARITSADLGYRLMELAQIARRDNAARQVLQGHHFDPSRWKTELPEGSPFKESFRRFIGEFGHRAVFELDIINPRWHEDPSYLFDIILGSMAEADIEKLKAEQAEKFGQAWRQVAHHVLLNQLEEIKQDIKQAQEGAALREMTKSVLVMALEAYRQMALELSSRLQQRGLLNSADDIFFCSWPDLFALLTGEWTGYRLGDLITDRRAIHEQKELIPAPDLIEDEKPIFCQAALDPSGNYLQGVPAATGKASGRARLISNPATGNKLQSGDILVAPSTDPGWTPLFLRASAVVMETGGSLSHGAIVAREFGIPAVVNVAGVMSLIRDGQRITVDGDEGKVFIGVDGQTEMKSQA